MFVEIPTTIPVTVVVFVTLLILVPLVPMLVRLIILVNLPTFDPFILIHRDSLDALLAIKTVSVKLELLVDTCQLVESEIATVILVVRLDADTRNAELPLGTVKSVPNVGDQGFVKPLVFVMIACPQSEEDIISNARSVFLRFISSKWPPLISRSYVYRARRIAVSSKKYRSVGC